MTIEAGTRYGRLAMRWALAAGVLCGAPAAADAQVLPPVPPVLQSLDWMVGDWEGEGWILEGGTSRREFNGTEVVERRMGGRVVVVEGAYTAWMGPEAGDQPVHQAMGVFWYDPTAERLRFRTFTAQGAGGDASAEILEDGTIVWGFQEPGRPGVRYTIRRTEAGEWHEVGERTGDGEQWTQFFEMTLRRRDLSPARTP